MKVAVEVVRELRRVTGAGLGDCREALEACSADMVKAKEYLREKGLAKAYKRSHRDTADGLVAVFVDGFKGAILKLGAETDFVARNERFCSLISRLVRCLHGYGKEDLAGFSAAKYSDVGPSVADEIMSAVAVLGENIVLNGVGLLELNSPGVIGTYVHGAVGGGVGKAAALVALESTAKAEDRLANLAKQIAMHVVAAKPESVSIDDLGSDLVEREKAIVAKQVEALGKPEAIAQKIIQGRMQKFYEDVALLEQTFVVDGQTKICDLLSKEEQDLGCAIRLSGYRLFSIN